MPPLFRSGSDEPARRQSHAERARNRKMQSQGKSPEAMLPSLARLHQEVQTMSRRVHGHAMSRTRAGIGDYSANVSALLDELIDHGDAQERVVCFASAAEFAIPMRHQIERCGLAALHTGSNAVRVLYWTAVRRMRPRMAPVPAIPIVQQPATSISAREEHVQRPLMAGPGEATEKCEDRVLCQQCKALCVDSCSAHGHDALRAVSRPYFRIIGNGVLAEAEEHECDVCGTGWTQHRSIASPFVSWSIAKHAALTAGTAAG